MVLWFFITPFLITTATVTGARNDCRGDCALSVGCWISGGISHGTCPGLNSFTSWLYTCCYFTPIIPPPTRFFKRRDSLRRQDRVECGVPALTLQKRIIGGAEAYFGELPWQAHLRIGGYQCGGALVSRKHVITAAHCVHRAQLNDIMVYLGEYDTQNTGYEPYPEEVHRVIKKYVHPNFQFRLAQPDRFDVALVQLSRGVIFKENILPICLPKRSTSLRGKTGLVAGWGKTDTTYGKTGTNILRKAIVPILTDAECLRWHRHKNIRVELHKEMFCAGHSDGRMDACLGDSGGPLIVQDEGRWTLAGITSAGFGCAVDHQPGIYHKVQFTSDWIRSVIKSNT
ncbi:trypsin-1 isoform X1 [Halyomorpha halys]|uniref:trypsin-1 isoform X1 n=1 Tax=Halyomorpha halys TaxID=286706 RepID=UPI0006D500B6|nr:trypsin-1 isoform X1 [Halyomorpha halys]